MIKDDKLTFEEFLALQENDRTLRLKTRSGYKQNHFIRQHLADVLLYKFDWQFWITFTFGYKPILAEVEDILYGLHYRIDRRLVKHLKGKSFLTPDERTEWILFPELGGRGLHYHGFLKFNVFPTLGHGYFNNWKWLKSALEDTIPLFNNKLTEGGPIDFKHYERSLSPRDSLRKILYSLKEYGSEKGKFDRFNYTIISHDDWKPGPIHQHRSPNKIKDIPSRDSGSLESFF